ncbi:EamA family transporter [Paenibacillus solanacearum]|uniref:EamA family transporter n=1 Tax=Paenibacillus solanacearum TaxID=2048548 RepID=UPI001FECAFA0|nr:EamA family transporter [Paenibacillus solanacearum]
MGAFGGYFVKKATLTSDGIIGLIKSKFIYIGAILYFLSALLNIFALKMFPYTVVLPITSITYVWSLLISSVFLNEKITVGKVIGVLLIFSGCVCIGVSTL